MKRRSLLKKHLEIDTQTCGKWGIDHMVKILKEYPQTNFTEWQLLKVTHSEQHDQDAWVNMVCKVWYPLFDPWNRVMCDWTIGNNSFTARDGNQVNHGKNHMTALPSIKIWNTTIAGKLVRLHGPVKSYFNTLPYLTL